MSKEADRAAVFRTTKVRTKLKGDASWLQRRQEPEAGTQDEKPWVAEVRASRLNGAPIETSPVSSPTETTPPKTDTERAPTSGYLIRGVFTPLDKPASPTTSNGFSKTTQFTKKPSETYKRIAPHTVRPTAERQEGQLSPEEQEKRTEAAISVLKRSAVKQRSYVFSAAKKYEAKEKEPDTSLDTSTLSFVAKRVEITDDDESDVTPAPASAVPPSPAVLATSVASVPEPIPRKIVDADVKTSADAAVKEAAAPKVEEAAPEPVKEDPAPVSVTEKDPFEDMKPGCTKVDTPLPELIADCVKAAPTKSEQEESDISGQTDAPLVELSPPSQTKTSPIPASTVSPVPTATVTKSPAPVSPAPVSPAPVSPVPTATVTKSPAPLSPAPVSPVPTATVTKSPAPVSPAPVSPAPVSPAPTATVTKSPAPVSPVPTATVTKSPAPVSPAPVSPAPTATVMKSPAPVSPAPTATVTKSPAPVSVVTATKVETKLEPEVEPEPEAKPSSGVDTLAALSDTLIAFDTSSSSSKDDEPALAKEEGGSADSHTTGNSVEEEPAPAISNCVPITDDLLGFTDGPEESAEPVPPSPGRWSQDLLSELESEPSPVKTSGPLDFLANDIILINTEAHSLSTPPEEEEQTDETAKETQSKEDNADPWSSHVTTIVSESSSADPFDPYPIETTSPNSSSDLLQPFSDTSINSPSHTSTEKSVLTPEDNALVSFADDVNPLNTDTTSTQRSWARTWEAGTPQEANAQESQDAEEAKGQDEEPHTLIKFERKSTENDSPWNRWTSPTVYTITSTTGEEEEEEEEEESPEDVQTVTTTTTIRETYSEPEPAMDRTVREEEQRVQTPEPETKKGFVYVKEYVNATELSLHNPRDAIDSGLDYLSSSSATYSYSSPTTNSRAPVSSTCTYCGEQVGNDAKITIEHLNINCHPACFKCGVCSKPMGDLLHSMFLHGGIVHCESCYATAD